ncbi:pirin family protein [bacterium]|nr:pirin family protein [bacterium]
MEYILFKADERGFSEYGGWLKSYFSFSFANWYSPKKMGFGTLRVLNDDEIKALNGFDMHFHKNMEIISIVLEGQLNHKDSMDNEKIILKNEIQRMSAGKGVYHSEYNLDPNTSYLGFQIWILPKKLDIEASYEQKFFEETKRKNKFQLVVSPDARSNSISINQDAFISLIDLDENKKIKYNKYLEENLVYIMNISGEIEISNIKIFKKDAIGILNGDIEISSTTKSKILILEIPKK